jgi:ligand-binding SRPBCC domain-containing protein
MRTGGARSFLVLERTAVVPVPLPDAWEFFADPRNLEAITPAWLRFRIESAPAELETGAFLRYRLRLFGVPIRWLTVIAAWRPPHRFVDVQLSGPYRLWEHTHALAQIEGGTEIHDHVRYRLPGGPLAPLAAPVVRLLLDRIFDLRARRTSELLGGSPPGQR